MTSGPRWRKHSGERTQSGARTTLAWIADWQIVPVGLLAPIFMLADRLPNGLVALAVLAILPVLAVRRMIRGRFFTPTPADVALLLFAITLPVGVWVSASPVLSLAPLLQALFGLVLFYALVNSLTGAPTHSGAWTHSGARRLELAGWGALAATALLVGLGLMGTAWTTGAKMLPAGLTERMPYLLGTFWYSAGFNPNIVGGALAVLLPLMASYARSARAWPHRLVLWLVLLTGTLALFLTQSRGAWLGFVVGLFVVACGRNLRWARLVPLLVVFVVLGLFAVGIWSSEPVSGAAGINVALSSELRLELLSRGIYMLQDFPLTGIGLGMFPQVLHALYPPFAVGASNEVIHVHNQYLQMGIEHGLPGLVAFLAFVILLWVMGIQAIRLSRGQPWEPLAIGLLAGLAAYCTHGMLDAIWHTPRSNPIIWACWGVLTSVWCWTRAGGGPALSDAEGPAD